MKKVIVYIAISVDGYIADKTGSVSWLNGYGSDNQNAGSYPEFIETLKIRMRLFSQMKI